MNVLKKIAMKKKIVGVSNKKISKECDIEIKDLEKYEKQYSQYELYDINHHGELCTSNLEIIELVKKFSIITDGEFKNLILQMINICASRSNL